MKLLRLLNRQPQDKSMNWEKQDTARLKDYFSKTGNRLRIYLHGRIPLCDGKTIEEVALKARYKEGYERALKDIDDLVSEIEDDADPASGNFTAM